MGGGRSHVLIAMFVEHVLHMIWRKLRVVVDDGIVGGTRCTLKRNVRVEIEVEFVGRGDISLYQTTRERVAFIVGSVGIVTRKASDMVSLAGNDDGDLAAPFLLVVAHFEDGLDMGDFLMKNMIKLSL